MNLVPGGGTLVERCKRKKGGALLFGLIASSATLLLGEVAKPIFNKIFGRGRRKRKYRI